MVAMCRSAVDRDAFGVAAELRHHVVVGRSPRCRNRQLHIAVRAERSSPSADAGGTARTSDAPRSPTTRPNRARVRSALPHPRRVHRAPHHGVWTHANIHPWQPHDSRRLPCTSLQRLAHIRQARPRRDRLHRGARLWLIATTASDCDTTPYRGLCLLHRLAIA